MARRSCDGAGFLAAFRSAVASLEAHVDEINALNVFPVPDGDTGTNMLATVHAALDEADRVAPGADAERIAQAVSFGALMGARGNSGVITSQILAGIAHGLAGKRRFNGLDLAHALDAGTKTAYKAVAKPVEGTILTVIREASAAAVAAAERDNNVETVLAATVDAAERAVREDAVAAADPARGARRRLGRAGPVPAVPGRARGGAWAADRAGHDRRARRDPVRRAGGRPRRPPRAGPGARPRNRGGRVRVRDRVPAARAGRHPPRRPGDPVAPRVDRRLGAGRRRRPPREGPRPQRPAGRRDRLRPDARARCRGSRSRTSTARPTTCASPGRRRSSERRGTGRPRPPGQRRRRARDAPAHSGSSSWPRPTASPRSWPTSRRRSASTASSRSSAAARAPTRPPASCSRRSRRRDAEELLILPNNPNVVLAARQVASMTKRKISVVPTRNCAEGVAALFELDPAAGRRRQRRGR